MRGIITGLFLANFALGCAQPSQTERIHRGDAESNGDEAQLDPQEDAELQASIMSDDDLKNFDETSKQYAASVGQNLLNAGRPFIGATYLFSAKPRTRTDRFDCSSFVWRAIYNAGYGDIPQGPASRQREFLQGKNNVTKVSKTSMQPGDIIFMNWGRLPPGTPDHVGFYAGNAKILDATNSLGVKLHNQTARYKDQRVLTVLRITGKIN